MWKAHVSNAGAATLTIVGATSTGPIPLTTTAGSSIIAGGIPLNGIVQVIFDGTAWQVLLGVAAGSGSPGLQNLIKNPGFTINQRGYISGAVLATGVPATGVGYGHDCWRGGAGGGDYSFSQLQSNTQITIAANKTLIQMVEGKDVQNSTYTLSWTGTALARFGINGAAPVGGYAASPVIIGGQTPGTGISVEFGNGTFAGTLGGVLLNPGLVANTFESRPYEVEEALCRRYLPWWKLSNLTYAVTGQCISATVAYFWLPAGIPTRIPVTGVLVLGAGIQCTQANGTLVGAGTLAFIGAELAGITVAPNTISGMVAGNVSMLAAFGVSGTILGLGAEL